MARPRLPGDRGLPGPGRATRRGPLSTTSPPPASRVAQLFPVAVAFSLAILVAGVVGIAGWIAAMVDALVVMGFDPDRAQLIAALCTGGLAAATGALGSGRRTAPTAAGLLAWGFLFGPAFLRETQAAVHAGFDSLGWVLTVATLTLAALSVGWACAVLALEVRHALLGGTAVLRALATRKVVPARQVVRAGMPVGALVLAALLLPVFADMINYTPDVAMTRGGWAGSVPLVGAAAPPSGVPLPVAVMGPSAANAAPVAIGSPPVPRAFSVPWRIQRQAGAGTVEVASLPSPWIGGRVTRSALSVYLPPGYRSSAQRFPVVYVVPWDLAHWEHGVHITAMLDQAVQTGALPPMIFVFIDLAGGPFPNSECANSFDGTEWADSYVSTTVVTWSDTHLRTIPDPRARTILGFSQGGFCAANLLVRHPDVFHQAVAFSGYFTAGFRSGDTVNAWRPFGRDPALVASNSPIVEAPRLAAAVRQQLLVVLSAGPREPIYGLQATAFARVLQRSGYRVTMLWNPLGHAWAAVRAELPAALAAVAARLVATGAQPQGSSR